MVRYTFPAHRIFLVALSEPLITGFYVRNDLNEYRFFEGFRANQVAIGLLTTASEGSGYMESSEINKALDYLTKGISFGGAYVLQNPSGYPDFSGIMGWSINCDKRDHDYAFVNNADDYFFGSITPETTYVISAEVVHAGGSYPEFVQPMAGDTVYMKGDKISFNADAYESLIDHNAWSPLA